jgi:hypothetical protein
MYKFVKGKNKDGQDLEFVFRSAVEDVGGI